MLPNPQSSILNPQFWSSYLEQAFMYYFQDFHGDVWCRELCRDRDDEDDEDPDLPEVWEAL